MDLDRQIQSPGGLPHGIEARIVNLHQLALLAQVKPQSLQNLQADRAFAFTLSQLAGLPLGVTRLVGARPGRLGPCDKAVSELRHGLADAGNGFGITAGEIDQRREIAFVHPLGDLLQLGAFLARFSRHLAPKPNRCVCTSMTGNFARAVGCSATCSMLRGSN